MSTKVASLYAEIGADTSGFQRGAASVKSQLNSLGQSFSSVLSSTAISAAIVGIGSAIKSAIDETLKYDSAVRQLAEVSGTGAEEASRLLQVMDDFKLTAADVNQATRAMTKEGLSPTIETLAKLSDQYNALAPGQARAEFLMINFGRSGLKFAEVMSKGGDALRAMGAEVEKSLIRTDEQIAKTRLAELAFDKWADAVQGLKVQIGSGFIGLLDGSTAAIEKSAQAIFKQQNGYNFNTNQAGRYTKAQQESYKAARLLATQQYLLANGIKDAGQAAQEATTDFTEMNKRMDDLAKERKIAALSEASARNQDFISMLQNTDLAAYADESRKSLDGVTKAQEKLNVATRRYGSESKQALNAQAEVDAAVKDLEKLRVAWLTTSNKDVFKAVEEKLTTSGGGLNEGEKQYLEKLGIELGLFTELDVQLAETNQARIDAYVAAAEHSEGYQENLIAENALLGNQLELLQNISATGNYAGQVTVGGVTSIPTRRRDIGGPGMAGTPYQIGVPEVYVPNTGGEFIPLGGASKKDFGGTTYNIIVNNPKKETAENSIRRSLKLASYTGSFT